MSLTAAARAVVVKAPKHARSFSDHHFVSLLQAQRPHVARSILSSSEHQVANRTFLSLLSQWSDVRTLSTSSAASAAHRPADFAKHEVVPENKLVRCSSAGLLEQWW